MQRIAERKLHCRIWTQLEIQGLNYLHSIPITESTFMPTEPETVILKDDLFLQFEVGCDRDLIIGKLKWLKDLGEGYFLCGVIYQEKDWEGGGTVWMLKMDPDEGFIPLFDTTKEQG
jgi:hypothetical protein